ncbi:hypothetical protein Tco_0222491 [Tanacetum coccineum]
MNPLEFMVILHAVRNVRRDASSSIELVFHSQKILFAMVFPLQEDQHSYDVHRDMRKVIAFQTWLSKFPIILDQQLDLEVLTSYSNITVVEDQSLIFQQLMSLLLDKD